MRIDFCLESEAEVKEYLAKDLYIYKLEKELEASRALNRTYEEDRERLCRLLQEETADGSAYGYIYTAVGISNICEAMNIPVEQFKPKSKGNDYDD